MPGKTIGKELNHGFAGSFARMPDMIIDTHPLNDPDGTNPAFFGDPLIFATDGSVSRADATLTADNFAGVAGKEIKSQLNYLDQNEGGKYTNMEAVSVMKRGPISVLVANGTPVLGGPVYVRIALNPSIPTSYIGSFDAVADVDTSGTADVDLNVLLPNCVWITGKDTNGIAELLIRTRNI